MNIALFRKVVLWVLVALIGGQSLAMIGVTSVEGKGTPPPTPSVLSTPPAGISTLPSDYVKLSAAVFPFTKIKVDSTQPDIPAETSPQAKNLISLLNSVLKEIDAKNQKYLSISNIQTIIPKLRDEKINLDQYINGTTPILQFNNVYVELSNSSQALYPLLQNSIITGASTSSKSCEEGAAEVVKNGKTATDKIRAQKLIANITQLKANGYTNYQGENLSELDSNFETDGIGFTDAFRLLCADPDTNLQFTDETSLALMKKLRQEQESLRQEIFLLQADVALLLLNIKADSPNRKDWVVKGDATCPNALQYYDPTTDQSAGAYLAKGVAAYANDNPLLFKAVEVTGNTVAYTTYAGAAYNVIGTKIIDHFQESSSALQVYRNIQTERENAKQHISNINALSFVLFSNKFPAGKQIQILEDARKSERASYIDGIFTTYDPNERVTASYDTIVASDDLFESPKDPSGSNLWKASPTIPMITKDGKYEGKGASVKTVKGLIDQMAIFDHDSTLTKEIDTLGDCAVAIYKNLLDPYPDPCYVDGDGKDGFAIFYQTTKAIKASICGVSILLHTFVSSILYSAASLLQTQTGSVIADPARGVIGKAGTGTVIASDPEPGATYKLFGEWNIGDLVKPVQDIVIQDSGFGGVIQSAYNNILRAINIILVLMLLFLAIVNILQIQISTYNISKILPTLIIGFLVAQGSMFIIRASLEVTDKAAGGILGMGLSNTTGNNTNNFSNFIDAFSSFPFSLKQIANCDSSLGDYKKLSYMTVNCKGKTTPKSEVDINKMLQLLISDFFTAISGLALLILAVQFLLRRFVFFFLIPLAPIAAISFGFPPAKTVWTRWWKNYSGWILQPIVAIFWLWLALVWFEAANKIINAPGGGGTVSGVASYVFGMICVYAAIKTPGSMVGDVKIAGKMMDSFTNASMRGAKNIMHQTTPTGSIVRGYNNFAAASKKREENILAGEMFKGIGSKTILARAANRYQGNQTNKADQRLEKSKIDQADSLAEAKMSRASVKRQSKIQELHTNIDANNKAFKDTVETEANRRVTADPDSKLKTLLKRSSIERYKQVQARAKGAKADLDKSKRFVSSGDEASTQDARAKSEAELLKKAEEEHESNIEKRMLNTGEYTEQINTQEKKTNEAKQALIKAQRLRQGSHETSFDSVKIAEANLKREEQLLELSKAGHTQEIENLVASGATPVQLDEWVTIKLDSEKKKADNTVAQATQNMGYIVALEEDHDTVSSLANAERSKDAVESNLKKVLNTEYREQQSLLGQDRYLSELVERKTVEGKTIIEIKRDTEIKKVLSEMNGLARKVNEDADPSTTYFNDSHLNLTEDARTGRAVYNKTDTARVKIVNQITKLPDYTDPTLLPNQRAALKKLNERGGKNNEKFASAYSADEQKTEMDTGKVVGHLLQNKDAGKHLVNITTKQFSQVAHDQLHAFGGVAAALHQGKLPASHLQDLIKNYKQAQSFAASELIAGRDTGFEDQFIKAQYSGSGEFIDFLTELSTFEPSQQSALMDVAANDKEFGIIGLGKEMVTAPTTIDGEFENVTHKRLPGSDEAREAKEKYDLKLAELQAQKLKKKLRGDVAKANNLVNQINKDLAASPGDPVLTAALITAKSALEKAQRNNKDFSEGGS